MLRFLDSTCKIYRPEKIAGKIEIGLSKYAFNINTIYLRCQSKIYVLQTRLKKFIDQEKAKNICNC